jgi:hypothetical protein
MKKIKIFSLALLISTLLSCSGSDRYRGLWKATDPSGNKFEITFDAKYFVIKDTLGESNKYDYTQNSVKTENSVETYGIKLSDGRGYKINFPNSKDESIGLIFDENGNELYTISRKDYIKNQDIFKLK